MKRTVSQEITVVNPVIFVELVQHLPQWEVNAENSYYPNATIAEHGLVFGHTHMMKEIYERGPMTCGINANAILEYKGGILDLPHESKEIDHIISIVGWGYDDISGKQYWIIRNSWGEYWGEMGFI